MGLGVGKEGRPEGAACGESRRRKCENKRAKGLGGGRIC